MPSIKYKQLIKKPINEVFSFFEKPENLERITPRSLQFEILSPKPINMAKGSLIDYKIKIFGIPQYWKTQIVDYNPPSLFSDKQIKGPYSHWFHTHSFIDQGKETLMVDEVKYSVPFGLVGSIANIVFVKDELDYIFDYRKRIIEEIFEGENNIVNKVKGEQKMKVIVAGGSGFIGKTLIKELKSNGHEVILLTRKNNKSNSSVQWDGKSSGGWEKVIDGADAVINLCGETVAQRWNSSIKKKILDSRLESSSALVNAIKKATNKPKVLINASAVGYYGNVENGDVTEAHESGNGFLAETCIKWEDSIKEVETLGLRVVKLRIGIVLEKEGGALKQMLPPFLMCAGGPLGSGKQWFPWVHRDDVVDIINFALQNENVSGPINVTAPGIVTNKNFGKALGNTIGRPAIAPAPSFALKLILGEMAEMLLGGQKAIPKKLQDAGYEFKHPNLEEALETILK